MNTKALKQELHVAIEGTTDYELSDKEKKQLDHLHKLHKAGKTKSYTVAEVRKYAAGKLKKTVAQSVVASAGVK